jgi:hypothetical protein
MKKCRGVLPKDITAPNFSELAPVDTNTKHAPTTDDDGQCTIVIAHPGELKMSKNINLMVLST